MVLPCKHAYGEVCLRRWLSEQENCPRCGMVYVLDDDAGQDGESEDAQSIDSSSIQDRSEEPRTDSYDLRSYAAGVLEDGKIDANTKELVKAVKYLMDEAGHVNQPDAVLTPAASDLQVLNLSRWLDPRYMWDAEHEDKALLSYAAARLHNLNDLRYLIYMRHPEAFDITQYTSYSPIVHEPAIDYPTRSIKVQSKHLREKTKLWRRGCNVLSTFSADTLYSSIANSKLRLPNDLSRKHPNRR